MCVLTMMTTMGQVCAVGLRAIIKFIKNIGFLLLAIWLILTGLATFISALGALSPILAILAIVAGVFIIIGR